MESVNEWLDAALYPDVDPPKQLKTLADRVDFLARLCSAWDFGILPRVETIAEIRKPDWQQAVDACNLLTSPTYHLLLEWHGLDRRPFLGQKLSHIKDDPWLYSI